jgi:hypothetical protein
MASVQKIVEDVGSEELRLLRTQYNTLLQVVEDLFAAIDASTDASGIKSGAALIDVTGLRQLVASYAERPAGRRFPVL